MSLLHCSSVKETATPSTSSLQPFLKDIRKQFSRRSVSSYFSPGTRGTAKDVSTPSIEDVNTLESLEAHMARCVMYAESQAKAHHDDKSPAKQAGRTVTATLIAIQDWFKAYSGVVQLMAGVSQGYSTTAIEALALFLVVSLNCL